ncbi:hypothetical protein KPATCC21470_8579 [Kitasatospora purpeofusca]
MRQGRRRISTGAGRVLVGPHDGGVHRDVPVDAVVSPGDAGS